MDGRVVIVVVVVVIVIVVAVVIDVVACLFVVIGKQLIVDRHNFVRQS